MLFNSLEFLLFFPIVAIVLFLILKRMQWSWYFNNKAISNFNLTLDKINLLNDLIPEGKKEFWLQSASRFTSVLYNLTTEKEIKFYNSNDVTAGEVLGYESRIKQYTEKLEKSKINFDQLYQKAPSRKLKNSEVLDPISLEKFNELLDIAEENLDIQFLLVNSIKLDASSENQFLNDYIKDKVQLCKNV